MRDMPKPLPTAAELRTTRIAFRSLAMLVVAACLADPDARSQDVEPAVASGALRVDRSLPIDHATHHVQGLAADPTRLWLSSVDRAAKVGWVYCVDRQTGRVTAERKLVDGDRYHPGGMQLTDAGLWVPLAEYRPRSTTVLLLLDPDTLETIKSIPFDDHIGALAAGDRGQLLAGNWDCRRIYRLTADGERHGHAENPTGVAYQDFELHDGRLWGVGGAEVDGQTVGVVDVIDLDGSRHERRWRLEGDLQNARHFGREGFTRLGGELLVMPEDGPHTTVYTFRLPGD